MTLYIIIAVIVGNLFSELLRIWLTPLVINLHGPKCPKCRKRIKPPTFSFPCVNCTPMQAPEMHLSDCAPIQSSSTVDLMKNILRDEEGMKLLRKMIGIQSEREKFEEEAEPNLWRSEQEQ